MKKKVKVMHKSGVDVAKDNMPRYNAYQGGYGVHKSQKHPSRNKIKSELRKQIGEY